MSGTTNYFLCDQKDHAHLFQDGEAQCPVCGTDKQDCVIQPTISIRATLEKELDSPIFVLKLMEYLSDSV